MTIVSPAEGWRPCSQNSNSSWAFKNFQLFRAVLGPRLLRHPYASPSKQRVALASNDNVASEGRGIRVAGPSGCGHRGMQALPEACQVSGVAPETQVLRVGGVLAEAGSRVRRPGSQTRDHRSRASCAWREQNGEGVHRGRVGKIPGQGSLRGGLRKLAHFVWAS